MSVNSCHYIVDWTRLTGRYRETRDTAFIIDALEQEESWLRRFEFQGDQYVFESWSPKIEFSDWYHQVKSRFPALESRRFFECLLQIGAVTDERSAFRPIQELTDGEHEWVLGAISPERAGELALRFRELDLSSLASPMEAALRAYPLDEKLWDYPQIRRLLEGYASLLRTAGSEGRGVLILTA